MNIVGLDLSLAATGVCTDYGLHTVKTRSEDPLGRRLTYIKSEVGSLIAKADLLVVEGLFVGHNTNTIQLAKVHGIIEHLAWVWAIPIAFISPATLKKFAVGTARAEKADMKVEASKVFGVEGNNNEIDAFWLRFAGRIHYGDSLIDWPKDRVGALHALNRKKEPVIDWPAIGGA